MKLTVLGNNGPFPAAGGACSGYLIQNGNSNILIDCGSGVLSNLFKYISIDRLDMIILSHLHSDHVSDMAVLKYAVQINKKTGFLNKNIKIYLPDVPEEEYKRMIAPDAFELNTLNDDLIIETGNMMLNFCKTKHPYKNFAVSIKYKGKKFVYSGDTSWENYLIEFFRGADLLMLDSGLLERDRGPDSPHLSARECGKAAAMAGAGKLFLTHIRPGYDPNELLLEAKTGFDNTMVAEMLKTYEI